MKKIQSVILFWLLAGLSYLPASASLITLPNIYSPGQTLPAASLNQNFQTIYNDYNGNVTNANLASNAGITLSKLSLNPGNPAFDQQAASSSLAWGAGLTTDTQPRAVMNSGGQMLFGPGGTTVPDVSLQRSAAGTLQLQSPTGTPVNPTFDMNGGTIVNCVNAVPYGTIVPWWSTDASPPTGWALCNGASTTWQTGPHAGSAVTLPNLIGMGIQGSDLTGGASTANPSGYGSQANQSTQGAVIHGHTYSGASTTGTDSGTPLFSAASGASVAVHSHTHTFSWSGSTSSVSNQSAVICIVYIIKL